MKEVKLIKHGWDHEPSLGEVLEDIFENYINISVHIGGFNTWWCVIRDNMGKAVVPVQVSSTLENSVKMAWIKLEKVNKKKS